MDMLLYPMRKYIIWERINSEELRKDFSGVSCSVLNWQNVKHKWYYGMFSIYICFGKNVAAEAIVSGIYDVRLENDVLKLSEDQVLYQTSQPIQGERFWPVAFQSEHVFIRRSCVMNMMAEFEMDTKTMKRSGNSDAFRPLFNGNVRPLILIYSIRNLKLYVHLCVKFISGSLLLSAACYIPECSITILRDMHTWLPFSVWTQLQKYCRQVSNNVLSMHITAVYWEYFEGKLW